MPFFLGCEETNELTPGTKKKTNQNAEVQRRLTSLAITFAIMVYLSAAFVSALERYYIVSDYPIHEQASLVNFHDSLYFMVTSFTTVGYGDVKPSATPTRYLSWRSFVPIGESTTAKHLFLVS